MSTPHYPKHLLNLVTDRSLLQSTYDRAKLVAGIIYIISETSHVAHVYDQLPEIPAERVIVEPGRRGTASCVIAALARIKQTEKSDEPIVFMHADHHIRDNQGFGETLQLAARATVELKRMVLLGVEPTHPATSYGYIERGKHLKGVYEVNSFKEKPNIGTAQKYMNRGRYLWNMGYFIAPLTVFEATIEASAPELWNNYQSLLKASDETQFAKTYLGFTNEPIDTALIEKVDNLLVAPGSFDWMDLGSYPDVHQVSLQDEQGNTVQGKIALEGVVNSYVRNDTEVPVVVIGLDNVAIVSTPDGILVTNKSYAQRVGAVSKQVL